MEQLVLKIKDSSKRNILLELLQQLDFVEISIPKVRKKTKAQQELINMSVFCLKRDEGRKMKRHECGMSV